MTRVFANWPWVLLIFNASLSPNTTIPAARLRRHRRKRNRFLLRLYKSANKKMKWKKGKEWRLRFWGYILKKKKNLWKPRLSSSTLVSLRWYALVEAWKAEVSGDGGARAGGGGERKVCRFNFAELRSRGFFASCRCTCLLFIFRSENVESGRWQGATCSPLRGCSCLPPSTPWKALLSCAEIYRPSPPLDAVWPPPVFSPALLPSPF